MNLNSWLHVSEIKKRTENVVDDYKSKSHCNVTKKRFFFDVRHNSTETISFMIMTLIVLIFVFFFTICLTRQIRWKSKYVIPKSRKNCLTNSRKSHNCRLCGIFIVYLTLSISLSAHPLSNAATFFLMSCLFIIIEYAYH